MVRKCVGRGAWLSALVLAATGCGTGGPTPVRGTVKLDGRPLANASVLFIAQDPGGKDATGFTDANGVFRLSTTKAGDGALPGKYKVVVQLTAQAESAATQEEAQANSGQGKAVPPSVTLPARFSEPDQTILMQVVPSKADVLLELTSE